MNRALSVGVLLVLTFALHFQGLGQLPFYTVGEPREALEIWEEIHNGEWILPSRNGIDLPSKPPLFHWLGGLTALATGDVDEFTARFPSALLATLTVLLVYWFGARKWGTAAGMYAACLLATNFEWIRAARSARVDMVLTAFLTGALVAFEAVAATTRPRLTALVLFYLCMGLATLAKGPMGFVLPGLTALIYLALRRDLGRVWHMHVVRGGLLAVALPGCWYLLAMWRGGEAFVHKQILVENLMTFFGWTSDPGTPTHSFFYVVPAFFAGFAPWSLFVIPLGISLYRDRNRLDADGYLLPLVWFVTIFLFFTVAAGKRAVYLLPVYPAAAILLGAWWSRLSAGDPVLPAGLIRLLQRTAVIAAIAMLIVAVAVVAEGFDKPVLDLLRPFLHHTDQENLPLVHQIIPMHQAAFIAWAAVFAVVTVVFAVTMQRKQWARVFASLVVFVAGTALVVNGVLHPELAQGRTFKPFVTSVRAAVGDEDQLAFYHAFDYGTVFYWRQRIPVFYGDLDDPSAVGRFRYFLLPESAWKQLGTGERVHLDFVRQSEGTGPDGKNRLVLVSWRPTAAP